MVQIWLKYAAQEMSILFWALWKKNHSIVLIQWFWGFEKPDSGEDVCREKKEEEKREYLDEPDIWKQPEGWKKPKSVTSHTE